MRHLLVVALLTAGPLFKCTGAHAAPRAQAFEREARKLDACFKIRATLAGIAQSDPDAFDQLHMHEVGVIRYVCNEAGNYNDYIGSSEPYAKRLVNACRDASFWSCK